jgi:hypothetical protein
MMPPAFFLLLKIALAIWGLLWFCKNFSIVFSFSKKNVIGILVGIALDLYCFMDILALNLLIPEHRIYFHLFVSSSISFQCKELSSLMVST